MSMAYFSSVKEAKPPQLLFPTPSRTLANPFPALPQPLSNSPFPPEAELQKPRLLRGPN